MKRFVLLLAAGLVSCASSSETTAAPPSVYDAPVRDDANEVAGEVAMSKEDAFREVRGAIFRGGNIIAQEDPSRGFVQGEWRNVQQALPLAVIRFIFTRHEDPQVSYRAQVTDQGNGRSLVVLSARGRHKINRFFRQEWSQPYALPRSEEIQGVLRGYLAEVSAR